MGVQEGTIRVDGYRVWYRRVGRGGIPLLPCTADRAPGMTTWRRSQRWRRTARSSSMINSAVVNRTSPTTGPSGGWSGVWRRSTPCGGPSTWSRSTCWGSPRAGGSPSSICSRIPPNHVTVDSVG
jgi:hypothetical protein